MKQRKFQVVLIEDDPDDFVMIRDLLRENNQQYELKWISNFESAVDELERQEADIYLIDYFLGEKTGLELIETSLVHDFTKPMILLSGHGNYELDLRAMEKGVSNFLSKNQMSSELLIRSIHYAVRKSDEMQRLRLADQMKIEKESALRAAEAQARFLAHVSHEIRTPLGAIIGFADLIADANTTRDEQMEYAQIINKSGHYLLSFLNNLLDISKIESGNLEISKENCPWQNVIEETVQLMSPLASKKGLRLDVMFEEGISDEIKTDGFRLRQILINLVSNAIKFTEKGGVCIEVRSQTRSTNHQELAIAVRDSGSGIPHEEQLNLFQPYAQANGNIAKTKGGTGLGLNLSRQLATAMGGELRLARSMPHLGSTFVLTLPMEPCKTYISEWGLVANPSRLLS